MRVLVLGATGFIGGQIVRATHQMGWEVHGLRRRPEAVGAVGDLPVVWHEGQLDAQASLTAAMRECEVVFHAAGYYPLVDRNIWRCVRNGTHQMRNVLQAAQEAGVQRVIYTSSLATIGPPPVGENRLADERDDYLPGSVRSSYYEVKWAMECEVARAVVDGLSTVTLVPTMVFGPGDVRPSTGQLLVMLSRGQLPIIVDLVLNMVDGRDVALAHVHAVEKGQSGERYIIGGHNVNLADAITLAAQAARVRPPLRLSRQAGIRLISLASALHLPIPETVRTLEHWRPLNTQKAADAFGLQPRLLEDTLRDTISWFRANDYC